ncbi:MAG TPA: hypothetical protein VNH11_29935 [Pirellulales bacterium]|nr:hypothetical protein [Pirellulales bacterium]HVC96640.1 hypothetical protein [Pirellulales bacterium]
MPLSEKARIEVYLPDLPGRAYRELLDALSREFTYTFGGCSILQGLAGSYLSQRGLLMEDRVNVVYTDAPFSLAANEQALSQYVDELRQAAYVALEEEAILVALLRVYHPA